MLTECEEHGIETVEFAEPWALFAGKLEDGHVKWKMVAIFAEWGTESRTLIDSLDFWKMAPALIIGRVVFASLDADLKTHEAVRRRIQELSHGATFLEAPRKEPTCGDCVFAVGVVDSPEGFARIRCTAKSDEPVVPADMPIAMMGCFPGRQCPSFTDKPGSKKRCGQCGNLRGVQDEMGICRIYDMHRMTSQPVAEATNDGLSCPHFIRKDGQS